MRLQIIDSVPADALHRLAWINPGTTMACHGLQPWHETGGKNGRSEVQILTAGTFLERIRDVDRRHLVKPTAEVILPTVELGV